MALSLPNSNTIRLVLDSLLGAFSVCLLVLVGLGEKVKFILELEEGYWHRFYVA